MVTFRFYAQLNDFLPRELRQCRFRRDMAAPRSVKDAIEALGVPHPEVALVVINGESADFAAPVHDGDDIAVYPAFRSLDVTRVSRTMLRPPSPPRFACDIHLRKLAALLRLCGFDADLLADDADVARGGGPDGRIALTRDVGLLKRGIVQHGYWVRATDPEQQLQEVVDRFDLVDAFTPFSRCLRCNTPLEPAGIEAIGDRVPPRTRDCFEAFSECPGCGRVYWKGSHYERLAAIVARARTGSVART